MLLVQPLPCASSDYIDFTLEPTGFIKEFISAAFALRDISAVTCSFAIQSIAFQAVTELWLILLSSGNY
jgi:hypothetical protein